MRYFPHHPVHIYIIKNKQHPFKRIRVDGDIALENSTDVTNLLVDDFKISMETTGGDVSWLNGKNERHNRSILLGPAQDVTFFYTGSH